MTKKITTLTIPEGQKYLDTALDENGKPFFEERKELPHGILEKQYPGIGATTLELRSKRDSILVLPFVQLAENKASLSSDFYLVPARTKIKSKSELTNYLDDESIPYKKLICVIDRLPSLYDLLEERGELEQFHLTIDEIDIVQMQSGFRTALRGCMDVAKKFQSVRLVTATMLNMSDSFWKQQPVYKIERKDTRKDHLYFVTDSSPAASVCHFIVGQIFDDSQKGQQRKFLVGLNDTEFINAALEEFPQGITTAILASEKNDNVVKEKRGTLKDGKLPAQVSFATSAYWSSYDIKEEYVSIAVSLDGWNPRSFSFENLIQFFGRYRGNQEVERFVVVRKAFDTDVLRSDAEHGYDDLMQLAKFVNELGSTGVRRNAIKALTMNQDLGLYSTVDKTLGVDFLANDLQQYLRTKSSDYEHGLRELKRKLEERFKVHYVEGHEGLVELTRKKLTIEQHIENLIDNHYNNTSYLLNRLLSKDFSSAISVNDAVSLVFIAGTQLSDKKALISIINVVGQELQNRTRGVSIKEILVSYALFLKYSKSKGMEKVLQLFGPGEEGYTEWVDGELIRDVASSLMPELLLSKHSNKQVATVRRIFDSEKVKKNKKYVFRFKSNEKHVLTNLVNAEESEELKINDKHPITLFCDIVFNF